MLHSIKYDIKMHSSTHTHTQTRKILNASNKIEMRSRLIKMRARELTEDNDGFYARCHFTHIKGVR